MGVEWLVGKVCTRVYEPNPSTPTFSFEFGPGILRVDCLWRIVAEDRLVRTSEDHAQRYGLPAPLDAYAEATSLLGGRSVTAVHLREETADLVLEFGRGITLEVLSTSSGYEPWQLTAPGVWLIGLGGGGASDCSSRA
jgi:hypothetical protein